MSDTWEKSSFCDTGSCVEVRFDEGEDLVFVRNSKFEYDIVEFTREEWQTFILGVGNGEFIG